MSSVASLIESVEGTIAQRSASARERTLAKITELLVRDAERLEDDQIALFDHVLGCFTPTMAASARAELADKLAELDRPPPKITRALAFDEEIIVAHPLLARSPQLSDQDLIDVAILRGREHMSAICERPHVSELVTDILVTKGDETVCHAIARNAGARFSALGRAELLDRSRDDLALQDLMGARDDLTDEDLQLLVEIARETAKAQLRGSMPQLNKPKPAVSAPANALSPGLDWTRAQGIVRELSERLPLSETDVASFAARHRAGEAICAIAMATTLPIPFVERIFRERDDDLLLIMCKAQNWSWRTVRALLAMRDPMLPPPPDTGSLEPTFDAVSASGARRTMHILNAGRRKGRPAAAS